jgi:fructosamine-3-kinase
MNAKITRCSKEKHWDEFYKEKRISYSTDEPTIDEVEFVLNYWMESINGHNYNEGCQCYQCMWNQFWPMIKVMQRWLKKARLKQNESIKIDKPEWAKELGII